MNHRFPLVALAVALAAGACNSSSNHGRVNPALLDPFTVVFPADFLWGSANSAYQSEGNFKPGGGRVESNWSHWEDLDRINDGSRNDVGAGFYTQYPADLDRAASDGHNAIRFGLEWARIEPERGVFDQAEMDHYLALIDACVARGLTPVVTFYHWVVPPWVADPATGLDRFATAQNTELWDDFDAYVRFVVPQIADKVDWYITFNEPYSVAAAGYLLGQHPPGKILDLAGATAFLFNTAFMHARAARSIRELDTVDATRDGHATRISLAKSANTFLPLDPNNDQDVQGAEQLSYIFNDAYMNAVVYGMVDADLDRAYDNATTTPPEGFYPELTDALDFIGINYYGPIVALGHIGPIAIPAPLLGFPILDVNQYDPALPHNGLNREISAQGFRDTLDLYSQWGLPFMITENGTDTQEFDQRAKYLTEHIYEVGKAMKDGLTVLGYLQWSLTDNFEWVEGYEPRFGLYRLDYTAQGFPRTRTNGAEMMSEVIAQGYLDRALYDRWAGECYPTDARCLEGAEAP
ncbi:MAG: glycoside hydrolase family 1 protein [Myxococcales bacterium]|nr:glycoside hydrolase family 1 protein [Myxococcales bacterium]